MKAKGFTLLECLMALALSMLVACAALEFFAETGKRFFALKEEEERRQDAMAALDRVRIDVVRAGVGLAVPLSLGLLEAVTEETDGLSLVLEEDAYTLASAVAAGTTVIPLTRTTGLTAGREICLCDGARGEIVTVTAVEPGNIRLAAPVAFAYAPPASVLLLEKVRLSFDAAQSVLRRKVNSGGAQPLLEGFERVELRWDKAANLVRAALARTQEGGDEYEITVYPKNPGLAGTG